MHGEKNNIRSHLLTKITVIILLFRHGQNNPTRFYPNDPHAKLRWKGGLGALRMKISTVLDVASLYNTLKAESDLRLPLPSWTRDIYPELLLPFAERSSIVFTQNIFMKRIKAGPFLTEVRNNMYEKTRKIFQSSPKLFLYSGHDHTLVNVMNSMGILDQTSYLPDNSSALVFELHEFNSAFSKDYEVKMVFFRDYNVVNPKPIDIPNCQRPCSLQDFFESISYLLYEDYDEI